MTRTLYDSLIRHARLSAAEYPSRAAWLLAQIAGLKAQRRYFAKIGRRYFVSPIEANWTYGWGGA